MNRILALFTLGCFLIIFSAVFSHIGMLEIAALSMGAGISGVAWAVLERVSRRRFHENLLMGGLLCIFIPLSLALKADFSIWIAAGCLTIGVILTIASYFKSRGKHDKAVG